MRILVEPLLFAVRLSNPIELAVLVEQRPVAVLWLYALVHARDHLHGKLRTLDVEPGLGVDGARYLAELGVVAIGSDSWGLEVLPSEDPTLTFPVHPELLAKNGVYILENMDTRALAADGVSEFLFVLGQPRFVGSVQAVINPVAIR